MMNVEREGARKVVLTCAQPTGKLHLGNYLGALKYWVDLSNEEECYFGIADMHAITMPYTPADLRKNVYDCLAQYLACGLNPDSAIFPQSAVKGHTDLAWCLACLCPIGNLERMTQFKDKSKKQQNSFIGSGLLYYPVLMAADILIYNADIVPVGVDQKQHMELARDLAQKFNATYSETFKIPEASIPEMGARIMSLQNPDAKMSKSDANQNSVIYITDSEAVLRKKIMSAVTDSETVVRYAEDKRAISNLMSIYSVITKMGLADIELEFEGKGYGDFKKAVAEVVIEHLRPIREKYESLLTDKTYLDTVLQNGIEKAQRRANRVMAKVWRKVGFYTK